MAAAKRVVVLVGPKGSGKTFIGTLAGKELGLPFLRVEPIFLENIRGSRLTGDALDAEGYAKVGVAVDAALCTESGLVIESTGAATAFPGFLETLRSKYEVLLVAIRAPLAVCLARVRGRDQSAHIPVSDDRVGEINDRAARVELPWDLEIDNSQPAPAEVIVARLRELLARRSTRR
ncbi:MAG: shikimate kinase [Deltaproteobacteria bacterium]|nr:shikimate kinase [Deltaproteobacteria bacterium]